MSFDSCERRRKWNLLHPGVQKRYHAISYQKTKEKCLARVQKWRQENPEKFHAQHVVEWAIESGKLIRPTSCKCGRTENIQAHHEDYKKPLEVTWLCIFCHRQLHRKLSRLRVTNKFIEKEQISWTS
jgi:hypothetical protein